MRGGPRLSPAAAIILVVNATGTEPVALRLKPLDRGADEGPRARVEHRHHGVVAGGGGDARDDRDEHPHRRALQLGITGRWDVVHGQVVGNGTNTSVRVRGLGVGLALLAPGPLSGTRALHEGRAWSLASGVSRRPPMPLHTLSLGSSAATTRAPERSSSPPVLFFLRHGCSPASMRFNASLPAAVGALHCSLRRWHLRAAQPPQREQKTIGTSPCVLQIA